MSRKKQTRWLTRLVISCLQEGNLSRLNLWQNILIRDWIPTKLVKKTVLDFFIYEDFNSMPETTVDAIWYLHTIIQKMPKRGYWGDGRFIEMTIRTTLGLFSNCDCEHWEYYAKEGSFLRFLRSFQEVRMNAFLSGMYSSSGLKCHVKMLNQDLLWLIYKHLVSISLDPILMDQDWQRMMRFRYEMQI